MKLSSFKRGILPLLILIFPFYINANTVKISNSKTWKDLLHLDKDLKPKINTSSFLLSYDNFSSENELLKTLEAFKKDKVNICKYPARYTFLSKQKNLNIENFDLNRCVQFKKYIDNTGTKDISLVFVSENVTNPSSMMGHIFFKLDGINHKGKPVQNAISFYTVIDTLNLPYLAIESTIIGMDGFFVLKPYNKQIYDYVVKEDRNIWEYKLKLSKEEIKLMSYHFWELKSMDMKYYFTGYNCATVVNDILKLSSKNTFREDFNLWLTPKDVIKNAYKNELILNSELFPSKLWNFKMLLKLIDKSYARSITDSIDKNNIEKTKNLIKNSSDEKLHELFAIAYLEYDYLKNKKSSKRFLEKYKKISNDTSTKIDISMYKNPLKTQNDSQISLSYEDDDTYFSFLPASHTLYDDNRQYSSESSLRIAELKLKINDDIKVEELNLYKMQSLIPWDNYSKNLSKELEINYKPLLDKNLNKKHMYNLSYSKGITFEITQDMFLYNLLGVGAAYGKNSAFVYSKNQFGIIIYEILNMKSTIKNNTYYNTYNEKSILNEFKATQSLKISNDLRLDLSYVNTSVDSKDDEKIAFSINYIF